MKTWRYVEPVGNGDFSPVYITLTEQEILDRYWDFFYKEVVRVKGQEVADALTEEDCLDTFIAIHWCWEVKEGDVPL